jgi:hypothetical protein
MPSQKSRDWKSGNMSIGVNNVNRLNPVSQHRQCARCMDAAFAREWANNYWWDSAHGEWVPYTLDEHDGVRLLPRVYPCHHENEHFANKEVTHNRAMSESGQQSIPKPTLSA